MSHLSVATRQAEERPRVSFEFFPPKNETMDERLWECVRRLEPMQPDFVSVTYGAGGSTRERTHDTVARIASQTSLVPAALADTALPQQLELFNHVRESTGDVPPVIDSTEVLRDPRGMLSALCDRLGVAFFEAMLEWPPGIRESDGIWAEHWYPEVETTTGWRPYKPKDDPVPDSLSGVLEQCNGIYEQLYPHRLIA